MPRNMSTITLEAAFEEPGCPICRLVFRHERQWLWTLLWENVNDPIIRRRIVAAWGFCHRHAWGLARVERNDWGDNQGTALIYEHLTNWLLDYCCATTRNSRDRTENLDGVIPGRTCPACLARARMESIHTGWLSRHCSEEWFAALYRSSDGLCMTHLGKALRLSIPPVRVFLLTVQQEKLEAVRMQLAPQTGDAGRAAVSFKAVETSLGLLVGANPYLSGEGRRDGTIGIASWPTRPTPPGGCTACVAALHVERRHLTDLLAPRTSAFSSPAGLCADHAWRLLAFAAERHQVQGVADWCHQTLDLTLEGLDARMLVEHGWARRGSVLRRWLDRGRVPYTEPARACAICDEMAQAGRVAAARLAQRPESAAEGSAAPAIDLCLRHLRPALPDAPGSTATRLRARQFERLRGLSGELRAYVRKHDWQYRDEPKGQEQTAWRRAVALFVGDEETLWRSGPCRA